MSPPRHRGREMASWLRTPIDDYLAGLEAVYRQSRAGGLIVALLAAALSWWIYVPLHELAHAFGCLATGGEVSRLEIDPLYGAALLQRLFPFVAVGSDYAGQLTGFETHGNDGIYFATDAAPFLLTILIGVPLLRAASRRPLPARRRAALFGASIPWAFAPFISIPGDFYEMASLAISRLYRWWRPEFSLDRWRSDDVVLLASQLRESADATAADVAGVASGLLLAVLLSLTTYLLGVAAAGMLSGGAKVSGGDTSA